MIVASCATCGEPEPCVRRCFDSVNDVFGPPFLGDDSAFGVYSVVAVETGGNFVVEGCIWQQVASDLFDSELVVWHTGIECVDDPISPTPLEPFPVGLITVAVGVTGVVEPIHRHSLTVTF